jgi:hypothetical protein
MRHREGVMPFKRLLLIAATACALAACDSGNASPTASPVQDLHGKWSSRLLSDVSGATGCAKMFVTFGPANATLNNTADGRTKSWLTIKNTSVKDGLVRLHFKVDDANPLVAYLRRDGRELRLVELRDDADKTSIKEAMRNVPESMRKLIDGMTDIMDRMFDLEQCS